MPTHTFAIHGVKQLSIFDSVANAYFYFHKVVKFVELFFQLLFYLCVDFTVLGLILVVFSFTGKIWINY